MPENDVALHGVIQGDSFILQLFERRVLADDILLDRLLRFRMSEYTARSKARGRALSK